MADFIITPMGEVIPRPLGALAPYQAPGPLAPLGQGFTMGPGTPPNGFIPEAMQGQIGATHSPELRLSGPKASEQLRLEYKPGAGFKEEKAQAPKALSKVGKFGKLARGAGMVGLGLEGMNLYLQGLADGQEQALPPGSFDSYLSMALGNWNPNESGLVNWGTRVVNAPAIVGKAAGTRLAQAGKDFYDFATKPAGSREPEKTDRVSGMDAAGIMLDKLQHLENPQGSLNQTIPLGLSAGQEDFGVPQMAMPQGIDTTEARAWLDQARPTAPKDKSDPGKTALLGLLSGASNFNSSDGAGNMLLKLGAGLVGGQAADAAQQDKTQEAYAKAQQDYAAMRAGTALDMSKMNADHQNKVLEVAFKNAQLRTEHLAQQAQVLQPKLIGFQGGVAVYQTRNPQSGEMQLQTFDTGLLKTQAMFKARGRQVSGGSPDFGEAFALNENPPQTPMELYTRIAGGLLDRSVGEQILGADEYEAMRSQAMMDAQTTPGTEAQKNEAFKQQFATALGDRLMTNPALLAQASQYSLPAKMLFGLMNSPKSLE